MRSAETVAIEVLRELRKLIEQRTKPEAHLIRVNPRVAAELLREDSGLTELEAETGKHFHFEAARRFRSTRSRWPSGTRSKIEQRALPFQVGDEVLVTIEEPHMFNADDAVARVDSYVVSVAGAASLVGERKLVGSTASTARRRWHRS